MMKVTPKEELKPVQWNTFEHDGITYDLSHLHLRTFRFERPAEGTRPAEVYTVHTSFTSHCFTRAIAAEEAYDERLLFADPDEKAPRLFDVNRYELSKQLPAIIQRLPLCKPRHNGGREKYFTVVIADQNGNEVEYDVFFKLRKEAKRLVMIIESAFVRDLNHTSTRPDGRPVSFWIILHHTRNGIKIQL
jgi:hypothetical protein